MGNVISSVVLGFLESPINEVRRLANRIVINTLANAVEPRPRPFSMAANGEYTTWRGLTDRTISGRQLPPADDQYMDKLPPIDTVVGLFRREEGKEKLDSRSTLLFPFFAQWFTDSFLRVKWKPPSQQDYRNNESNHEIDLNQIYGCTEEETTILRSMEGGKLKSQLIDGEEYPQYLFDSETLTVKPEFQGLYTDENFRRVYDGAPDEHKRHAFAVGLEHGNSTVGNSAMNTLFLREHNRVATVLADKYSWSDERIFQTTRNILIVSLIKVVFADYMNHLSGVPVRADFEFAEDESWYRMNWMNVEFNLLYRWHDLIPDFVTFGSKKEPSTSLRQNNRQLLSSGLDDLLKDASSQPAGSIGLGNTPDFLMPVRRISMMMARKIKLRSYSDYCREYGIEPPESFFELTGDRSSAAKLMEVYGTVEDVEFFVGIFAAKAFNKSIMGALITSMVAYDAITQLLTNPLVSRRVYNASTFSPEGMKIIDSTEYLEDIVLRNTGITDPADVAFGFDRRTN